MRLPYLQVDQDTWPNARTLAGLLAVDRHRGMSLILDLWSWGINLGPSDKPPSGVLLSPRAAEALAIAVDWKGKPGELVDALVSTGLIERLDAGIRVRGLSRYKRAWEKNRRKGHGRDAGNTAEPGENPAPNQPGPGVFPPHQTQTQTQTHITSPSEKAAAPDPADATTQIFRLEAVPPPPHGKPPRKRSPQEALAAKLTDQRARRMPDAIPDVVQPADANRLLKAPLDAGVSEEALLGAHAIYLERDEWARAQSPPCQLRHFCTRINQYVALFAQEIASESA